MENHESINISMELINNLIFESIRHVRDQKRADIPTTIKYIYKNEENKTINESTIADRITYLTNTNVLENKRSNNKDSYHLKDNTKDIETPYEFEVKTTPLLLIIQILHFKTMIMSTVFLRSKFVI